MDYRRTLTDFNISYRDCKSDAEISELFLNCLTVCDAVRAGTYKSNINKNPMLSIEIPWVAFTTPICERAVNAMNKYMEVIQKGNVGAVHSAVDEINAVRRITGYPDFIPISDFDIICNAGGSLGTLAQGLKERFSNGEDVVLFNPALVDQIFKRNME